MQRVRVSAVWLAASLFFLVAGCSSEKSDLPEPAKVIMEAPDKARDAADKANERAKEAQEALSDLDD